MHTLVLFMITAVNLCFGSNVLHSVSGEVASGNYTYYSLMYEGPIVLYLHSRSGDADLYISQYNPKPTYEPDTYCLQSSTCGTDVIKVPRSFIKPISIGVYGHPSHQKSNFLLEVVLGDNNDEDYNFLDEPLSDETEQGSPHFQSVLPKRKEKTDNGDVTEEKEKDESYLSAFLWSIADVLVEIMIL